MHGSAQSSFFNFVNEMWKLCKVQAKRDWLEFSSSVSAEFGSDFSHEGIRSKVVSNSRLAEFSTSPLCLLLLLVL